MANNFADLFEHAVDAMPDRIALVCRDRTLTFRELDQRANQLAHHLRSAGFGKDTHVGFQLHNAVETMEVLIACFKIRAVPININYRYTASELRYVFDNADLEVLFHHRVYTAAATEARASVESITHTIVIDDDQSSEPAPPDAVLYESALQGNSTERVSDTRSADDLFIMFTGGTTGMPKGVVWRQEDMWRVLGGGIDFYTGEPLPDEYEQSRIGVVCEPARWLVLPPLIHGAAMLPTFNALWTGNTVILEPRFDAAVVWQVVEQQRAQILVITGDAMARPLIDAYRLNPTDKSSLVIIASGAALLSQSVKNQLLELFPNVVVSDSVGSSETGFGGMGFAQKNSEPGRGPTVHIGRGAIVVDDYGKPAEVGQEGWLAKTGSVPIGYYKDPTKTAALFKTVDGVRMVVTDDRARMDEDGVATLIGRGNMVVNTGGEKVFVEEVEGVLKSCAGVFDAVVIGVPDERWGHRVAAIIAPTTAGSVDFEVLENHARLHLAGYKIPRSIWLTDIVARTPGGKPDYGNAKAYAAEHKSDHEV